MTTKWRGAHTRPGTPLIEAQDLFSAGANIMRYPIWIDRSVVNGMSCQEWSDWHFTWISHLKHNILPGTADNKRVVINIATPPGGFEGNKARMFFPDLCPWGRECLFDMWEFIAREFQNNDKVIGYGILNEPGGNAEQVRGLMKQCVRRIRTVDAQKRVVVTNPYSDPAKFDQTIVLADPNIWYEVHMYLPFSITHQGIGGRPYPKLYPTAKVNKETLRYYLSRVRVFQQKNRARIYAGEFSISNFADDVSRRNYLRDCIEIFEEYGWNWTYHAWREAPVWDAEPYPIVYQVLKDGWAKNGN